MTSGDFQEWQLGLELNIPIGNRRAHAGVRNAEFRLARERALLREQEHLIMRSLSDAYADVTRGYEVLQTVRDRYDAAQAQVAALDAAVRADTEQFHLLLDAQRRSAQAQSRYYEALVEYGLAIKNMHYEKGSLLDYAGIHLAEGSWSEQAHEDARQRLDGRTPVEHYFVPENHVITGPSEGGHAVLAP